MEKSTYKKKERRKRSENEKLGKENKT